MHHPGAPDAPRGDSDDYDLAEEDEEVGGGVGGGDSVATGGGSTLCHLISSVNGDSNVAAVIHDHS